MDEFTSTAPKTVEDEYSTIMKKLRSCPISLAQAVNFVLCPDDTSDLEDLPSEDEDPSDPQYVPPDEVLEELLQAEIETGQITANDSDSKDESQANGGEETRPQQASSIPTSKPMRRRDIAWRKVDFIPPDTLWKDQLRVDQEMSGKTPLEYVMLFFDNEVVSNIRDQTNIYAIQKEGKQLGVSSTDIERFLGVLAFTGIVKMPSYCSYRSNETCFSVIADAMSRDRFELIKKYLHFNDNVSYKPQGDSGYDKIHKVRPLIEKVRANFMKIHPEEHQVIDEQIVPTKQRISLKQYNLKKTHKWGYKFISRAGISGFVYDLEMYTGKGSVDTSDLGVGADFVLRLARGIPNHMNYKLFYDNWFPSLDLAQTLNTPGGYS